MKTTNALVAAALAGVFAAGTALTHASNIQGSPVAAETEKEKCPGKDKEKCPGKDKKKEGTFSVNNEAEKEKEKCPGKDKEKCPGKDKKKEGTIL